MQTEFATSPFAVVTGASRGIGAEYARALAARGYDLLLVARDGVRLEELAADLSARYRVEIWNEVLDLSKAGASHKLFVVARERRQAVDLLVNNAGFGLYGHFSEMPMERLRDMLNLHVTMVVETMRLFLPGMIERGSGAIINVASIVGLFPVAYLAEYAATKAFLVSLSEAVAQEVRGKGVRIQACCPGTTDTGFHAAAGYVQKDPVRSDNPAEVVAASLSALGKGTSLVTVGWRGRLYALFSRWVPRGLLLRTIAAFMKPRTTNPSDLEGARR